MTVPELSVRVIRLFFFTCYYEKPVRFFGMVTSNELNKYQSIVATPKKHVCTHV